MKRQIAKAASKRKDKSLIVVPPGSNETPVRVGVCGCQRLLYVKSPHSCIRRVRESVRKNKKEGLIDDCKKDGLARRQYRTAMKHLGQWGFAAFKPTTRGTVATLCDGRIYDINERTSDRQTTNARPTDDQRAATNKNEKKEKNEKKYSPHSDEWRFAELLAQLIVEGKPDFRRPELGQWAGEIGRMIRLSQEAEP